MLFGKTGQIYELLLEEYQLPKPKYNKKRDTCHYIHYKVLGEITFQTSTVLPLKFGNG